MRTVDPRLLVLAAVALQAAVQGIMSGQISIGGSLLFDTVAFGLCTVVFVLVRRVTGFRRIGEVERWLMVRMNVLSAITFIGFYASLTLIPASTTTALEAAVGPIIVAQTTRRFRPTATLLGGCALGLAVYSWDSSGWAAVGGALLAVVAGWGMARIAVLSRRLGDLGVGAITVTAHRFHLTYLLAAILWLSTGADPTGAVSFAGYGLLAVVAPLFLLQVGLQRADPLAATMIVVAAPSITYVVQVIAGAVFDPVTFALTIGVIVLCGHAARRAGTTIERAIASA
jgi:drug/metabolite transporter (DMT)-like permease